MSDESLDSSSGDVEEALADNSPVRPEATRNDGLSFIDWDHIALRGFLSAFYKKWEVLAAEVRRLRAELTAEKNDRSLAEVALKAALGELAQVRKDYERLKATTDGGHWNDLIDYYDKSLAQARKDLEAMTRERDNLGSIVGEYKFGQTASARILKERDAALARAEAYSRVVEAVLKVSAICCSKAKQKADGIFELCDEHENLMVAISDCYRALASLPPDPKEGAKP